MFYWISAFLIWWILVRFIWTRGNIITLCNCKRIKPLKYLLNSLYSVQNNYACSKHILYFIYFMRSRRDSHWYSFWVSAYIKLINNVPFNSKTDLENWIHLKRTDCLIGIAYIEAWPDYLTFGNSYETKSKDFNVFSKLLHITGIFILKSV